MKEIIEFFNQNPICKNLFGCLFDFIDCLIGCFSDVSNQAFGSFDSDRLSFASSRLACHPTEFGNFQNRLSDYSAVVYFDMRHSDCAGSSENHGQQS